MKNLYEEDQLWGLRFPITGMQSIEEIILPLLTQQLYPRAGAYSEGIFTPLLTAVSRAAS